MHRSASILFINADTFRKLAAALGLAMLYGCASVIVVEPSASALCEVPSGHLPPPGECRIWYPHRPPGQQPPPGNCHELQHRVPLGACLVQGD